MNFEEYRRQDLRLVMLKALSKYPGYQGNETILSVEADAFGHSVSRDVIRTEMRKLGELGAVTIREAGSVMVATLSLRGLEHVQAKTFIDGILQPSPSV